MPLQVAIHGDGIAACSCARLLQQQRIGTLFEREEHPSRPTVLLNTATQKLLKDVFELDNMFFAEMHVIRRRVVLWGNQAPLEFPHQGFVINEAALLGKLWDRIGNASAHSGDDADFTIFSTHRPTNGILEHFGSRVAYAVPVTIRESASDACFIESLSFGWVFLLPTGEREASVLAVGGAPSDLLANSQLIAPQITSIIDAGERFPAYPRMLEPLCGSSWLACGGAAMSFDPICGEGVGNAIRQAILGCAVVPSWHNESIRSHYSVRLLLGFVRHLETCREFYVSANGGDWWASEISALEKGIVRIRQNLQAAPPPQHRMTGFHLEKV